MLLCGDLYQTTYPLVAHQMQASVSISWDFFPAENQDSACAPEPSPNISEKVNGGLALSGQLAWKQALEPLEAHEMDR